MSQNQSVQNRSVPPFDIANVRALLSSIEEHQCQVGDWMENVEDRNRFADLNVVMTLLRACQDTLETMLDNMEEFQEVED